MTKKFQNQNDFAFLEEHRKSVTHKDIFNLLILRNGDVTPTHNKPSKSNKQFGRSFKKFLDRLALFQILY